MEDKKVIQRDVDVDEQLVDEMIYNSARERAELEAKKGRQLIIISVVVIAFIMFVLMLVIKTKDSLPPHDQTVLTYDNYTVLTNYDKDVWLELQFTDGGVWTFQKDRWKEIRFTDTEFIYIGYNGYQVVRPKSDVLIVYILTYNPDTR